MTLSPTLGEGTAAIRLEMVAVDHQLVDLIRKFKAGAAESET